MDTNEASETLDRAAQLSGRSRLSTRWFATYLLIFAVGSFAMAMAFAFIGPRWSATIVTPVWLIFVVSISLYANRQKAVPRGVMKINGIMMGAWALIWAGVVIGSFQVDQQLWWWIVGGLAMATPPLVARHIVQRQTSAL
ncbi:MAG TPA: hypothetical protein VIT20_05355 [Propionibacteriaceae bacterium]